MVVVCMLAVWIAEKEIVRVYELYLHICVRNVWVLMLLSRPFCGPPNEIWPMDRVLQ